MLKLSILTIIFYLFSGFALAQTRNFQTTRLISTAGAGVASISLAESSILNPASIGFFSKSEFSYLYNISQHNAPGQSDKFKNHGLIISDAKRDLKGNLSTFLTEDIHFKQKNFGISFAKLSSKLSSFGARYNYKIYKNKQTGVKKKRHILTIGNTFIQSKHMAMGFTLIDPFNRHSFEHAVILGTQIQLASTIYFMLDIHTNQKFQNFSDTFDLKSALQVKAFDKVYLRGGYARNKKSNTSEIGYGVDIRLEKFHISAAFKKTKILDKNKGSLLAPSSNLKDFVINIATRF